MRVSQARAATARQHDERTRPVVQSDAKWAGAEFDSARRRDEKKGGRQEHDNRVETPSDHNCGSGATKRSTTGGSGRGGGALAT